MRRNRLAFPPRLLNCTYKVLRRVAHSDHQQPKTPTFEESAEFRGVFEENPEVQHPMQASLGIAFSALLHTQTFEGDGIARVNDRVQVVRHVRPDGSTMAGTVFQVVERTANSGCFWTLYLAKLRD